MRERMSHLTMAAALLTILPASGAFAGIVYSDNFEGDTVGSAPAGWVSNNAGLTLGTAADTTTGGAGSTQSLDLNQTNNASTGAPETAIVGFTPVTLNDGDSLVLTFNAAATTATSAQDRPFRFGIYNSMTPSAISPTVSTTGTPQGYAGRLDEGAVATNSGDSWASVGFLGSSTTSTPPGKSLATTTSSAADFTNVVDSITMTILRTGANITNTVSVTSTNGTVTVAGTDSTTLVPADTGYLFNEIMIGQSGALALDYRVDNVVLTYNAATPEPASLGLAGMGTMTLLLRRRRKA